MDQPRQIAALGHEPLQTIDRVALKEKLDRGDDLKSMLAPLVALAVLPVARHTAVFRGLR